MIAFGDTNPTIQRLGSSIQNSPLAGMIIGMVIELCTEERKVFTWLIDVGSKGKTCFLA